jgi:hypothetical protein
METILNYKEKSIEQNVFDWLNKLYRRANFSFQLEKCTEIPEELKQYIGEPDENGYNYGDYDLLYKFSAGSWENWWQNSDRDVQIEGYLPLHVSKNGRVMFGWCKDNSQTPDSLKFTFHLAEKSETYSLHELIRLIDDNNSFYCYDNGEGKLNQFLFNLFMLCNFRKSESIEEIDAR